MFNDKSILITGGTGSFGNECVKYILTNYKPRRLIVFSRDEIKQNEMAQQFKNECLRFFIGDIRDLPRLNRAFNDVEYVLHAAALKHVNQAEYDPDEYLKTNVNGTQNVIEAAINNEVKKIILISTDKAANPISLYGSTKLTAEKLFIAANNMVGKRETRFSVCRFGNISGSRGSVIPYFKKLVSDGADHLPVTDPLMTRFLITAKEAVKFTLRCFFLMQGGETFCPKMSSIVIHDLVKAFGKQCKIVGIRPGEKLHEIMCLSELDYLTLEFRNYFVIKPTMKLVHNYNYEVSLEGERAAFVGPEFQYNSLKNRFLKVDEIKELI